MSTATPGLRDSRTASKQLVGAPNACTVSTSVMMPTYQSSTAQSSNLRTSSTDIAPPSYMLPDIGTRSMSIAGPSAATESQLQRLHANINFCSSGPSPTRTVTYEHPTEAMMPVLSAQRYYSPAQGSPGSTKRNSACHPHRGTSPSFRIQCPRSSC